MLHFSWCDSYAIGLPDLDAQHKTLLELIEKVQGQSELGAEPRVINALLDELQRYWEYHIATEEALLRAYRFPGYNQHRREHAEFICDINDHIVSYKTGSLSINKLLLYLIGWFVSHSTGDDKRFVEHVQGSRRGLGLKANGHQTEEVDSEAALQAVLKSRA